MQKGGYAINNFSVVYKILKSLEKAMDFDEFDIESIGYDAVGISKNRWYKIMEMLIQEGYIQGANVYYGANNTARMSAGNIRITLKGLEYLNENSLMKKAADIAKGIKEIIPGL